MKKLWRTGTFWTNFYCPSQGYLEKVMRGRTNGAFGIDKRDSFFHITHLKTGCGTFVCRSQQGAETIAEYLTEYYQPLLDSVKVSDSTVSNAAELKRLIYADVDLDRLLSEFALTDTERRELGLMPEHKMSFVS